MTFIRRLSRESVLITGLITAFFGVLVAFNVPLTDAQIGSVVGFIGIVMMLLRAITNPASEVVAIQPPGTAVPQAGPASPLPNGTDVAVVPADTPLPF